jgi:hypothetical protein
MVDLINKIGEEVFFQQLAHSPANLAFLETQFRDVDPALCNLFVESVDDSSFSLRNWVEALRVLGHWLDARGLSLSLSDQIGYVACATDAAGAGSNLTHLPSLVEEMLETYGCERAV